MVIRFRAMARRIPCIAILFITLTPLLFSLPATAQSAATAPAGPAATPTAVGPADALDRGVPRTAMLGYLQAARDGDYKKAAEYLNLSHISAQERAHQGALLAKHLKVVLDRTLWVDLEALSDQPEGDVNDGLPPYLERVGTIDTAKGKVDVLLQHVPREDGVLIWEIAAATVAKIPALFKEFGYGPIGDLLPSQLVDITFLEMALWQWIGVALLVVIAVVIGWLLAAILARILQPLVLRLRDDWERKFNRLILGPLRFVFAISLFYCGLFVLALSVPVQAFFNGVAKALVIAAITWLALRIADLFAGRLEDRFLTRGHATAVAMIPLARRTVKVLFVILAFLALLQNFGFNVTGIVAGLGVGGLAVALAAQETVKNFFGGVALIADQPVRVGDFCRFGDKVGTVEDISLWSTRIRTLDRTVISIPNAIFVGMQLKNFAKRDRIWLHPTIGLRYETSADQLRYVLVEIKRMLLAHPKVDPDPARIRFTNFNAYSLDLEIFAYILTPDINEFLAIQKTSSYASWTSSTPAAPASRFRPRRSTSAQTQAWTRRRAAPRKRRCSNGARPMSCTCRHSRRKKGRRSGGPWIIHPRGRRCASERRRCQRTIGKDARRSRPVGLGSLQRLSGERVALPDK